MAKLAAKGSLLPFRFLRGHSVSVLAESRPTLDQPCHTRGDYIDSDHRLAVRAGLGGLVGCAQHTSGAHTMASNCPTWLIDNNTLWGCMDFLNTKAAYTPRGLL